MTNSHLHHEQNAERQATIERLLATVRRLSLHSRQPQRAIGAGAWRSKFRGQGMEFEEVRQYEAGDDVRHIDWAATARTNEVLLKTFREERELRVSVAVDMSASMRTGATKNDNGDIVNKSLHAAAAVAHIAMAAVNSGDRIGSITFDSELRHQRRPLKGRGQALQVLSDCLEPTYRNRPASLATIIRELPRHAMNKHGIFFVISDFLDHDPDLPDALLQARRGGEIIGVRIHDPQAATLPAALPVPLQDPESRLNMLAGGSRRHYAMHYQAHHESIAASFLQAGTALIDIGLNEDPGIALAEFLRRRGG